MLRGVLKDELTAIRDKYGDDRVTEIQDVEDELDIEDLIEEEQCVFTLTQAGYIKRTPVSEYAAQSKGGQGRKGITTREEDYVVDVFTASTHDYLLFFTDTGKVYRKKGYQIPESGKAAKGTNIVNILQVEPGERVQTMIHFRDFTEEELRGEKADYETILHDIIRRDEQDRNRPVAPLRQAEDAVLVDTTRLNLEESLEALLAAIKERTDR